MRFTAVALASTTIVWWLVLQVTPERETLWHFLFNSVYGLPFLLAGGYLIAHLVRFERDQERTDLYGLYLLALGLISNGIAQFVWTYYNLALGESVPIGSVTDLFYVLSYVLSVAGLVALLMRVERERARLLQSFFAATALAAIPSAFIVFLIVRTLGDRGGDVVLTYFYAGASLLTATLAISKLVHRFHDWLRPFLLLFVAYAVVSGLGDILFAFRSQVGAYWNGDVSDGLYALAGLILLGLPFVLPKSLGQAAVLSDTWGLRKEVVTMLGVALFGLLVAGRVSQVAYAEAAGRLRQSLLRVSEIVADSGQYAVRDQKQAVQSLAGFFEGSIEITQDEFATFVRRLNLADPLAATVGFVGKDFILTHVIPPAKLGIDVKSLPGREQALERTSVSEGPVILGPTIVLDNSPGQVAFIAARKDGNIIGYVAAALGYGDALSRISPHATAGYEYYFRWEGGYLSGDGKVLYDQEKRRVVDFSGAVDEGQIAPFPTEQAVFRETDLSADGFPLTLVAYPSPETLQRAFLPPLIAFVLTLSLFLLASYVASLYLSQRSRLVRAVEDKTKLLNERIADLSLHKLYLDRSSDAIAAIAADRTVAYANAAAMRLLGLRAGQAVGKPIFMFLFAQSGVDVEQVEHLLARGERWQGELRVPGEGAEEIHSLDMDILPLTDGTVMAGGLLLVARDLTERREVERLRTRVWGMTAHHLRTPINEVRWAVETLLSDRRLPTDVGVTLAQIAVTVREEERILRNLLGFAQVERGALAAKPKPLPIRPLLAEIIEEMKPFAQRQDVKFRLTAADSRLKALSDPDLLSDALRNIIDNAVRHAAPHTAVSVSVRAGAAGVTIRVANQGGSIDEEDRSNLFDPGRPISGHEVWASGMGIGLYLAKKFVEACSGNIRHEPLRDGAAFFVDLPLAKAGKGNS